MDIELGGAAAAWNISCRATNNGNGSDEADVEQPAEQKGKRRREEKICWLRSGERLSNVLTRAAWEERAGVHKGHEAPSPSFLVMENRDRNLFYGMDLRP